MRVDEAEGCFGVFSTATADQSRSTGVCSCKAKIQPSFEGPLVPNGPPKEIKDIL